MLSNVIFCLNYKNIAQSLQEVTERADEEGYYWELAYLSYEERELTIKDPLDLLKPFYYLYDIDQYKIIELMSLVIVACAMDSFIEKIGN